MKPIKRALALSFLSLFLPSCVSLHYKDVSYGYGTFFEYHLFEGTQKDIDGLIELVSSSSYDCDKDAKGNEKGIAEINEMGRAVVSDYLLEELKLGVEISRATNGYFSLFCGSLKDLWLSNLNDEKLPNEADILAETELISKTSFEFNGNEVIKTGEAKLDLGAIGKGFCLNKLKDNLTGKGIGKYWVSAGGSSVLFGENPNGNGGKTKVELEDLPGKSLYLKDCAISVSSCKKQLYEVEGKKYSHIVNPFSGSAEVDLQGVIAIGEDAAILDALSTAVYLEGEGSVKRYEELYETRFILVRDDAVIYSSDGIILS